MDIKGSLIIFLRRRNQDLPYEKIVCYIEECYIKSKWLCKASHLKLGISGVVMAVSLHNISQCYKVFLTSQSKLLLKFKI